MELTRRNFLAGSAMTVAAGMLAATGCSPQNDSKNESETSDDTAKDVSNHTMEAAETIDCDLVVCGSGISGMSATLEGVSLGMDVVLLEKLENLGGTLFGTEGIMGVGSKVQEEMNIEVPSLWPVIQSELEWTNWRTDPLIWQDFIAASGDDVNFLIDNGAIVANVSGFPKAGSFQCFHEWENRSGSHSSALLAETTMNCGARVYTNTPMTELKVENGKVTGVYATRRDDDSILEINAKAVLIASGSAADNFDLIEQRSGMVFPNAVSNFGMEWTGDGIILAAKYGAKEMPIIPRCTPGAADVPSNSPLSQLARIEPMSLLINPEGLRYAPETIIRNYGQPVLVNVLGGQQGKTWTIIDEATLNALESEGANAVSTVGYRTGDNIDGLKAAFEEQIDAGNDFIAYGETLDELAEAMKVDVKTFKDTVDRYNELCEQGEDVDFGKEAEYLHALENGPFYAVSPIMNFFGTLGGIAVDRSMRVLRADGTTIEGLYASGVCACDLWKETYNVTVSGGQNAYCCYSGRHAAQIVKESL